MPAPLTSRDITIVFRSPLVCDEDECARAHHAIIELACALARMAAEEDDASEAGA